MTPIDKLSTTEIDMVADLLTGYVGRFGLSPLQEAINTIARFTWLPVEAIRDVCILQAAAGRLQWLTDNQSNVWVSLPILLDCNEPIDLGVLVHAVIESGQVSIGDIHSSISASSEASQDLIYNEVASLLKLNKVEVAVEADDYLNMEIRSTQQAAVRDRREPES